MLFLHWILSVNFFRMLEAAERVTDEIALDQSADSHVRVGALGAASAHDHTTVSQRSSLLSPCPPLRLSRHESWAEPKHPPQYTKDWDTKTPQVPWSLTPDSAAVSCLITSTFRLCWRYFSWPSGRCHASNMVLFIDTKPESHYICTSLLHFILFLTSM